MIKETDKKEDQRKGRVLSTVKPHSTLPVSTEALRRTLQQLRESRLEFESRLEHREGVHSSNR